MHIPDGFLNNGVSAGFIIVSITSIAYSVKKIRSTFLERIPVLKNKLATYPEFGCENSTGFQSRFSKSAGEKILRLAATGALIFAAQMINFPINGGTSGHLLGGVLAALILGPYAGLIAISIVLIIQAAIFGDGGILALGANIFNMGIIGTILGFHIFRFVNGQIKKINHGEPLAIFISAWLSVLLASIFAAIQIAISGTKELSVVLPAMGLAHSFIGLGEALITITIISILKKSNYALNYLEK